MHRLATYSWTQMANQREPALPPGTEVVTVALLTASQLLPVAFARTSRLDRCFSSLEGTLGCKGDEPSWDAEGKSDEKGRVSEDDADVEAVVEHDALVVVGV